MTKRLEVHSNALELTGDVYDENQVILIGSKKIEWEDRIPTDSCKYPIEEIMGAQNFNFPNKFPKIKDVQNQILYFWKKNFR